MRDKELILEILHQIEEATSKIVSRFQTIRKVSILNNITGVKSWENILLSVL